MANTPKKMKDPTEAALSAIQDALSVRDTPPHPNNPSAPVSTRPEEPAPEQPWLVPCDTRLDATATAAALGVELPDLDDQLRRLERSLACTT